ncbi:unnamed protein product [Didymodactylos carnosus]|uniref:Uncharacterized protein n=1 Tax=Didymodactylos carnosus TaxID=1234261 RepID=A0A815UUS9_9BILA|nr:unnamed protein product [Didymodactylos carnosus]CAF4386811.1 unnamed protein product [Didymodactylos carnosus]
MRLDGTRKGARQNTDMEQKMKKARRDAERGRTGHKNKQVERNGTRHGETRNGQSGAGQDGKRRGKERKETCRLWSRGTEEQKLMLTQNHGTIYEKIVNRRLSARHLSADI